MFLCGVQEILYTLWDLGIVYQRLGDHQESLMRLHKHIGYLRVDIIPGYNLYSEQDRPRNTLTLPQGCPT